MNDGIDFRVTERSKHNIEIHDEPEQSPGQFHRSEMTSNQNHAVTSCEGSLQIVHAINSRQVAKPFVGGPIRKSGFEKCPAE